MNGVQIAGLVIAALGGGIKLASDAVGATGAGIDVHQHVNPPNGSGLTQFDASQKAASEEYSYYEYMQFGGIGGNILGDFIMLVGAGIFKYGSGRPGYAQVGSGYQSE